MSLRGAVPREGGYEVTIDELEHLAFGEMAVGPFEFGLEGFFGAACPR